MEMETCPHSFLNRMVLTMISENLTNKLSKISWVSRKPVIIQELILRINFSVAKYIHKSITSFLHLQNHL